MKPYYEDGGVTIFHGDALDVMADLPPASVDHVVTDPPYILQAGSSSQRGSKTGGWADMMNAAHTARNPRRHPRQRENRSHPRTQASGGGVTTPDPPEPDPKED